MKILGIFVILFSAFAVNAGQIELRKDNQLSTEGFYSYNFGLVWVYSRSAVRYTVRNTGTTPLTFANASMYGSFAFSANHSCGTGLLPNQICDFVIEFAPMLEGFSSGRFDLRFVEDQIVVDLWGEARR